MYDKDFQYTLFIVFQLLHMAFGKWQKGRLMKLERNWNAFKYDMIDCCIIGYDGLQIVHGFTPPSPLNSLPHLYNIANGMFMEGRWCLCDKDFQHTFFFVIQLLHVAFEKWQKGY